MVEVTSDVMNWIILSLVSGMFFGAALGLLGGWIGARNIFKNAVPEYDMESLDIMLQPIPVTAAKICLDCDVLFNTNLTACPRCASLVWEWLSKWMTPKEGGDS